MLWEPKVDAVWARLIVRKLEGLGLDAEEALRSAGLTRAEVQTRLSRIPIESTNELFEAAAGLSGDDHFGVRLGLTMDPREIGLLAYLGLS